MIGLTRCFTSIRRIGKPKGTAYCSSFRSRRRWLGCYGRLKGKVIVRINDHSDIWRVFKGFYMESLDITYTVGGGRGGSERVADF